MMPGMTSAARAPIAESPTCLGFRGGVEHHAAQWQGQPVFMKILSSGDPEQQERFSHEGRINGRLSHPLLVPDIVSVAISVKLEGNLCSGFCFTNCSIALLTCLS